MENLKKNEQQESKKILSLDDLNIQVSNLKEVVPSIRPREDVGGGTVKINS